MKIEKKVAFEPITITLETEEEALMLWHYLYKAEGISLKDYVTEHEKHLVPRGLAGGEIDSFMHEMFNALEDFVDEDM